MALHCFYLILFALAISAQKEISKRERESSLPLLPIESIKWKFLNHTTLQLSWNETDLSNIGVHYIEATAAPINGLGDTTHEEAEVETETITFYGLLSNTDYKLTLYAHGSKSPVLHRTIYFTTGPDGGESTSTTRPTEGKEGATSSGAPALTSTISAVLLAYMAVVLT
ncbi:hypothetical protein ECG_08403 [Echinococcus granulosus]|nr:hypothetical protein ECG_08403 [Echinococcus granulosus]